MIMIGREDIEIEPAPGLEVDLEIGSAHAHDQNPVMTRANAPVYSPVEKESREREEHGRRDRHKDRESSRSRSKSEKLEKEHRRDRHGSKDGDSE